MNYYKILNIPVTASSGQIEKAYHRYKSSEDLERKLEVSMAYTILSDKNLRDKYDRESGFSPCQRFEEKQCVPYHYDQSATKMLSICIAWFIMAAASILIAFLLMITGL